MKPTMRSLLSVVIMLSLAAVLFSVDNADGVQYSFYNITVDPVINAANDAADQVFVDVTSPGAGKVLFLFSTVSGQPGILTQVSFDDDLGLLGAAAILDVDVDSSTYAGVDFKVGGASISPIIPGFDLDFSATKNGSINKGVNIGTTEILGVEFDATLALVLNALDSADAPNLRIGIHIQELVGGDSQKAVNNGTTRVPDGGATLLLLGVGLLAIGGLRRFCA